MTAKLLITTTIHMASSEGGASVDVMVIEFDTIQLADIAYNLINNAEAHDKYTETSVIKLYKSE
jgi:hypothetical protein